MYGSPESPPYDPFGYYDSLLTPKKPAAPKANDWKVHDVYGIPKYEDAYGRPMMPISTTRFNPYAVHTSRKGATNEAEENYWGVRDPWGIRPHEDAYGRPVLTQADVWHPFNTRPEQYRKKLLAQLVEDASAHHPYAHAHHELGASETFDLLEHELPPHARHEYQDFRSDAHGWHHEAPAEHRG